MYSNRRSTHVLDECSVFFKGLAESGLDQNIAFHLSFLRSAEAARKKSLQHTVGGCTRREPHEHEHDGEKYIHTHKCTHFCVYTYTHTETQNAYSHMHIYALHAP